MTIFELNPNEVVSLVCVTFSQIAEVVCCRVILTTADSRVWTMIRYEFSEKLGGVGCERPIQPSPRSVSAPRPPTPHSAPAPSFFYHAPLRSAPPDFRPTPLRFPLRSYALISHEIRVKSQ